MIIGLFGLYGLYDFILFKRMSDKVKLYQELKEIEDIISSMKEISKKIEQAKTNTATQINKISDVVTDSNVIQYLKMTVI